MTFLQLICVIGSFAIFVLVAWWCANYDCNNNSQWQKAIDKMTVKELQDDVEIKIGYGPKSYPIKFVMADIECVVLCNKVYKANPKIELLKTLAIYGKREI